MPTDKGENSKSDDIARDNLKILKFIETFDFPNSPFDLEEKKKYSEVKLRGVARYITNKIQQYLSINSSDNEVLDLLNDKLDEVELREIIDNNNYKDIIDAKTLVRCFEKNKVSDATLSIFRAFRKVAEYEKEKMLSIKRIEGIYYVFNSHNTTKETLQTSIINITSKKSENSTIKFLDRAHVLREKRITIEVIGNDKILISLREKGSLVNFYAYITADTDKPQFFQAVYFYSNRSNKTISNIAIFARVNNTEAKEVYKNFKPTREKENLKIIEDYLGNQIPGANDLTVINNIQYYLLNIAKPIVPQTYTNTRLFDFSRKVPRYPSINQQEAKNYPDQVELRGDYFIYFNEKFSSIKLPEKYHDVNPFFSTVGRGEFRIIKDPTTGVLRCRMLTKKNIHGRVLLHSGFIINHTLDNLGYLIIALYLHSGEEKKTRYLNLHVNIDNGGKLIGSFNISYASERRSLGCGTVVLIKKDSILKDYNDKNIGEIPDAFYAPTFSSESNLEKRIVNYLSNKSLAITIPPDYNNLKNYESNAYEGVYKMYNYDYSRALNVSLIQICNNGLVIHLDLKNEIAYGKAEKSSSNILSILLKNKDTGRTGFCCIKVGGGNISPILGADDKDTTIYLGTFSGVSRDAREVPIASKFIIEFIGKNEKLEDKENEIKFIQSDSELLKKNAYLKNVYKYFSMNNEVVSYLLSDLELYTKGSLIQKMGNLKG